MKFKPANHQENLEDNNMQRKFILFFIVFLLLVFPFSRTTFAQMETDSNSVITRVGNPPTSAPQGLVKAGEDIKLAYDTCNGGSTINNSNLQSCLDNSLQGSGYSPTEITAFNTRIPNTLVANGSGPVAGIPCTQCLGFVGLALTLMTEDASALSGYPNAANIANLSSFTAGENTYKRIPASSAKPGDISAIADDSAGHIYIVKDVQGALMVALEANAGLACKITDDGKRPVDGYVFFSAQ